MGTMRSLIVDGLDSNFDYTFRMAAVVTTEELGTIQGPLSEEAEFMFVSEGTCTHVRVVLLLETRGEWCSLVLSIIFAIFLSLSLSFVSRNQYNPGHHCVQCAGWSFGADCCHHHHTRVSANTQVSFYSGQLTCAYFIVSLAACQSYLSLPIHFLLLLYSLFSPPSLSLSSFSLLVNFILS